MTIQTMLFYQDGLAKHQVTETLKPYHYMSQPTQNLNVYQHYHDSFFWFLLCPDMLNRLHTRITKCRSRFYTWSQQICSYKLYQLQIVSNVTAIVMVTAFKSQSLPVGNMAERAVGNMAERAVQK